MVGLSSDPFSRPIAKRSAQDAHTSKDKRVKTDHEVDARRPAVTIQDEDTDLDGPSNGLEAEDERFFGDGLSAEQTQALDYLAQNDVAEEPNLELDRQGLRRMINRLEKAIKANDKMRGQYPDDPAKFMDSELELHKEIGLLSSLSDYPQLYRFFVEFGGLDSLLNLMSHENADIACDAVTVLGELIDAESTGDDQAVELLTTLRDRQAFEILASVLSRLDKETEIGRSGLLTALSIFDNVVGLDPSLKAELCAKTNVLQWCFTQLQERKPGTTITDIDQTSAELLSILIEGVDANVKLFMQLNPTDPLLMLIAPYRKIDPAGALEEEYQANLFELLCVIVSDAEGKDQFLEAEGVELMQRLVSDSKSSETRRKSLQVLEFACAGWLGGAVCVRLIEAGMLRDLFTMFMKKSDLSLLQIILGIFVAFFRTLNEGESERIRVMNKFTEKSCQKVDRLLDLRSQYAAKVGKLASMQSKSRSTNQDEGYQFTDYLDRLDAGLAGLQLVDICLAWLIGSEPDVRAHMQNTPDVPYSSITSTLTELLEATRPPASESAEGEVLQEIEMLESLITATQI